MLTFVVKCKKTSNDKSKKTYFVDIFQPSYNNHPLDKGSGQCSQGHEACVTLKCGAPGCQEQTEEVTDISMALELLKLHRAVCQYSMQVTTGTRPAKRMEAKPPKFLEKESREDLERKKVEFNTYRTRTAINDVEASMDLYNSCETPLKRKLMSSARVSTNPAETKLETLLDEIEILTTEKVNKAIESGSQASNSKSSIPSKTKITF